MNSLYELASYRRCLTTWELLDPKSGEPYPPGHPLLAAVAAELTRVDLALEERRFAAIRRR
ncbi:MAG: hypothetical protein P1P77_07665 [Spirochaetaceae bacterium]|nr:hypothetical protein [Spirochaetaceae bacterium]